VAAWPSGQTALTRTFARPSHPDDGQRQADLPQHHGPGPVELGGQDPLVVERAAWRALDGGSDPKQASHLSPEVSRDGIP
jgi:hypothetical protein